MPKIKLSADDVREIEFMVCDGYPYSYIAKKFGVSEGYVSARFGPRPKKNLPFMNLIVYPNIAHWMYQNEISRSDLAKISGISLTCVKKILHGSKDPDFDFIQAVLRKSGMTFRKAFIERRCN